MDILLLILLVGVIGGLLAGFPVAFVLGGVSLIAASAGDALGIFDMSYLSALPNRIYGIMTNELLLAVPLFVFMGVMLERSKIAEELLQGMAASLGKMRSGLGLSVMIVGALMAASTGIVGATVVTMGLISLPTMLRSGYNPRIATGTICAAGTLGQIIPPSIVLILLGDQISSAHQTAQMRLGNIAPEPVSIADIFVGALVPGIILVLLYMVWLVVFGKLWPDEMPPMKRTKKVTFRELWHTLFPPLLLIVVVLGAILTGVTTATEAAAVGAMGAIVLAATRKMLNRQNLMEVVHTTAKVTCMVFAILIGATVFTLVFRGFGGDDLIHTILVNLPGGLLTVMLLVMLVMFLLGFFLDFIEIIFVVVPIVAPILLSMGANPVWLAVMIAMNLQTSFLTPPFGFALFYLRGVAPKSVKTSDIYKGVIPFVCIQGVMLLILALEPKLVTTLPDLIYGVNSVPPPPTLPVMIDVGGVDF
jgi:tripartite ATP-independent transporter DctM subunit